MSEKPVAERLQVKGTRRLAVLGAPGEADAGLGADDRRSEADVADVVLLFVRDRAELDRGLVATAVRIRPDAILWLAYPKLTSRLAGDLSRDVIRELARQVRLDTVSQIAIDADWSALRLKRAG